MIFCTPWFLLFSLVVAVLYLGVRSWRLARLVLMLAASVVFYLQFSGFAGLVIMGFLALYTYLAGRWMSGRRQTGAATLGRELALWLAPPVLALIYFRYYGFVTSSLQEGLGSVGEALPAFASRISQGAAPVLCPLGISFFAFEFCHYLVDIWKGSTPVRNGLHFALFALFYPRLAAGPIVRYQQIVPQFQALPVTRWEDVSYGLLRIGSGFAKKFLLADQAAQLVAVHFQAVNLVYGTDVLWLCLLLYVRIYMDFSGYCDMAIGLARLWGVRLPENFNFPFLARSPSAFWRRWHITLSTWIRDYIYIPLGGGRVPAWRKGFNLLFAMALCGLWHGPAWNFVLWGVLHGVALQIGHGLAKAFEPVLTPLAGRGAPEIFVRGLITAAGWGATQVFVAFTWIVFFYPVADAWKILKIMGRW